MKCANCHLGKLFSGSLLCLSCFEQMAIKLRKKYGRHKENKNERNKWWQISKNKGMTRQMFDKRIKHMTYEEAATTPIKTNKKAIHQYTINGEYVRTYESQSEAARKTGIDRKGINKCCLGRASHAGGYLFRTAEEVQT